MVHRIGELELAFVLDILIEQALQLFPQTLAVLK
jgi:hypothetical protein